MKRLTMLGLLALCSCTGVSEVYVAADRATFDALAPEYAAYVAADPQLDEPAKATRMRTLETWRLRIEGAGK